MSVVIDSSQMRGSGTGGNAERSIITRIMPLTNIKIDSISILTDSTSSTQMELRIQKSNERSRYGGNRYTGIRHGSGEYKFSNVNYEMKAYNEYWIYTPETSGAPLKAILTYDDKDEFGSSGLRVRIYGKGRAGYTSSYPTSEDNVCHQMFMTISNGNAAPNKPTNLSPGRSDINNPAHVHSLTPTLSWSYSDPDGNPQGIRNIEVYDATTNTVAYSVTNHSSSSVFVIPSGNVLKSNRLHKWRLRVADDKLSYGPWSSFLYFKTTSAPVCNITSPLGTEANPLSISSTPRVMWDYSDADGNGQKSVKVIIKKKSDSSVVHDSGNIISQNKFYDVPANILQVSEQYTIELTVIDSTDMQSEISGPQYILINKPPTKPTNGTILNNSRVNSSQDAIFTFTLGTDEEGDSQKLAIQFATNEIFDENNRTLILGKTVHQADEQAQYYDGDWKDIPNTGIIPTTATKARFNIAKNLTQGKTYYVRARGLSHDTESPGEWSEVDHFRYGDRIIWTTDVTNTTDKAIRVVGTIIIKNDTSKYTLLVEASNNANDDIPVWQDVTTNFIDKSSTTLTNSAKTAEKWGIALRITIVSTDLTDTEEIELEGFGFAFD